MRVPNSKKRSHREVVCPQATQGALLESGCCWPLDSSGKRPCVLQLQYSTSTKKDEPYTTESYPSPVKVRVCGETQHKQSTNPMNVLTSGSSPCWEVVQGLEKVGFRSQVGGANAARIARCRAEARHLIAAIAVEVSGRDHTRLFGFLHPHPTKTKQNTMKLVVCKSSMANGYLFS